MMEPFEHHTGIAAPLMQINIDTDAIIPSREMKSVSKKGLEDGLFAEWRYLSLKTRKENPELFLIKTHIGVHLCYSQERILAVDPLENMQPGPYTSGVFG